MARTSYQDLLDAGVHFGHLTRKWNPKMAPYIFMEKNGIHIIDLNKTLVKVEEASAAIKQIVKSGRKVLFVATKKQAKDIVAEHAKRVNMPFVTERWLGGMLTNFATVRKSIKKMSNIDKMAKDGTFEILSKKEKLMITRDRIKLERVLGGIADLNRLPAALFIIDVKKEHIAVTEALKLNIPTFAMVDTNSDPTDIDFAIPANDDATKSISLITGIITKAIEEGLEERKREREEDAEKEGAAAKIAAETAETTEKSADKATDKSAPRKRKSESTEKSAE
ncbi:MAG: 30S ribosomal protein S2 [Sphingobacteriales bacterium]|jgi:small subunit ribosomal protein S2|nr:30S ribosomal protein S2 [Sphingobacteriales bacterium]